VAARSARASTIVCAAALLFHAVAVGAQVPDDERPRTTPSEPQPTWQYGAFVDVAHLCDSNHPLNRAFRGRGTTWRVDEWDLNMAGAFVKRKANRESPWGAELLVQEGKDSELFGFSATAPNLAGANVLRHVGLANVSYVAGVGQGLTFQAGIFSSLVGFDSLYAKDNLNYTRPWSADFTPYLMMGINAGYPFTEHVTATFLAINGYWHLANANNVPTEGVQVAYKPAGRSALKQTVLWGPHQSDTSLKFWRFLSDTVFERRSSRTVAAFEYQLSTEVVNAPGAVRAWWMAAQLPMRWIVRKPWAVAVRPEIAWDSDGRWTSSSQTVGAITTTVEYGIPWHAAQAFVRFEHRSDSSHGKDAGFFSGATVDPQHADLKPTQHLWGVALILTFDRSGF
jgi:hypothetical protein